MDEKFNPREKITMPRQLQLTQNLLDRAATAWNVVYSTVSFLINFPSHFEAFVGRDIDQGSGEVKASPWTTRASKRAA